MEPASIPELNSSPSGSQDDARSLDFKNVPAFSSPGRTVRSGLHRNWNGIYFVGEAETISAPIYLSSNLALSS